MTASDTFSYPSIVHADMTLRTTMNGTSLSARIVTSWLSATVIVDEPITLSEAVMALKKQHPDHTDASVLLEPDIEYDHLIQVMDAVRSAEVAGEEESEIERVALFTDISIGDAP